MEIVVMFQHEKGEGGQINGQGGNPLVLLSFYFQRQGGQVAVIIPFTLC